MTLVSSNRTLLALLRGPDAGWSSWIPAGVDGFGAVEVLAIDLDVGG